MRAARKVAQIHLVKYYRVKVDPALGEVQLKPSDEQHLPLHFSALKRAPERVVIDFIMAHILFGEADAERAKAVHERVKGTGAKIEERVVDIDENGFVWHNQSSLFLCTVL